MGRTGQTAGRELASLAEEGREDWEEKGTDRKLCPVLVRYCLPACLPVCALGRGWLSQSFLGVGPQHWDVFEARPVTPAATRPGLCYCDLLWGARPEAGLGTRGNSTGLGPGGVSAALLLDRCFLRLSGPRFSFLVR